MGRTVIGAVLVLVVLLVAGSATPACALAVGEKAPDFTLPATTQEKLSLGDFIGKKHVVLFGFIGAFTPT
jgi:cytochrome oxidase Cu insertion factor (SCO1/SenC/PrrC family)